MSMSEPFARILAALLLIASGAAGAAEAHTPSPGRSKALPPGSDARVERMN